jgi:sugar phosphate isomerase/epimerase
MKYSGYADEAAGDLAGQIRATKALGWDDIELRNIDGRMVHDLDEAAFDRVAGQLADAGIGVHCLGSGIANGGKRIDNPADPSLEEAKRCVPRMRRLGTRLVRMMSWPLLKDRPLAAQLGAERIARLGDIVALFTDAGMTPVHENCGNWGGLGWRQSLELVERLPGLKLVFDPGNAVRDPDLAAPPLADGSVPRLSPWDFYRRVREHVVHVHVKDAIEAPDGGSRWCWPGAGHGDLRRIFADLGARGYAGALTIEPHLGTGEHHGLDPAEAKRRTYVEYGFRTMALWAEAQASLAAAGLVGERAPAAVAAQG